MKWYIKMIIEAIKGDPVAKQVQKKGGSREPQ